MRRRQNIESQTDIFEDKHRQVYNYVETRNLMQTSVHVDAKHDTSSKEFTQLTFTSYHSNRQSTYFAEWTSSCEIQSTVDLDLESTPNVDLESSSAAAVRLARTSNLVDRQTL